MEENKNGLLQWAIELQSLAQAGLTYGKDVYDLERYERIREIAAEMVSQISDISVGENTVKEVKEEAGLDVVPERMIAVQDRAKHNLPEYAYGICKVFILCRTIGGEFEENSETTEARFFAKDNLPQLATEKSNEEQIAMCFEAYHSPEWITLFD